MPLVNQFLRVLFLVTTMSSPSTAQAARPNTVGGLGRQERVKLAFAVQKGHSLEFTTDYLSSAPGDNVIQRYFDQALEASTGPILLFASIFASSWPALLLMVENRMVNGRRPWVGDRLQDAVPGISVDFCAHLSSDGPVMLPYFDYEREGR